MAEKIIVTVNEGKIRGFKTKSVYSGTEFYSFLGVPYGQSTEGQARYKDPVKVKPWNNVLDATTEKEGCLQYSYRKNSIAGDEDCLYNDIHTTQIPQRDKNKLKAVIVCVHPGGFCHGSPDPDYFGSPEYIMNHDVVYVCIGYRLYVLGHLNLSLKNQCTGNQCIKDVILSLKWIRDNIHVFGGDPENVTILGSSSGSAIVHLLLLSPLAKGLFHKAILMGMYLFNPTLLLHKEHISLAYGMARQRGYDGTIEDKRKLLNFYKNMDISELIESHRFHIVFHEKALLVFPSSPFEVMSEPGENEPLPISLEKLIPSTTKIPIIIGFCNREGIMGVAISNKLKRSLSEYFHKSLTQNVWGWGANLKKSELRLIQNKVEDFYANGKSIDTVSESIKCDILTDVALSDVYDTLINVESSDPCSPVYVYKFSYDGKLYSMKDQINMHLNERTDGAFHGDDYSYWCCTQNLIGKSASQIPPKDREMIDTMTNLFTTFAKTGNPNNDKLQVNWKPSTPENPCHLSINETMEMKDEFLNGKRTEFWHDLKKQFR